jgi:glycine cleavage system H protein
MPVDPQQTTYFKQARFTTRLPNVYSYARSHYWICEIEPGVMRIGMTKFAARMLGDFVEIGFNVATGEPVERGQAIGSIEGFKAVADLYNAVKGVFLGRNPAIERSPDLVDTDPYDLGWLYQIQGSMSDDLLDVSGYIGVLNATIEKMLEDSQKQENRNC